MVGSESEDSLDSSSASGSTPGQQRSARRRRSQAAPATPSGDKAEVDSGGGRRGLGGGVGLSPEDLQELHKNDPKRAKRILANRSSAARSKVRKLRYISELESKSASLREEANALHVEFESLHHETQKLTKEYGDLIGQAVSLQEHMVNQRQETEKLMQQVRQLQVFNSSAYLPQLPPMPSVPAQPSQLLAPQLQAYQDAQEEQLLSLQFPRRPPAPQNLTSFATVASMFQKPGVWPSGHSGEASRETSSGMEPPPLFYQRPQESPLSNAELSGSSGPFPRQEAGLNSDVDPGLLELLSLNSVNKEPDARAYLPPLQMYGRANPIEETHANLGMLASLPSLDSRGSAASSLQGLRSLPPPPHHSLVEAGRHRSVSSVTSSYSTFFPSRPTMPPNVHFEGLHDLQPSRQGLALWPRHYSDPQGFNRGPYG